ncbi:OmpA family protein [Alkanindiges sp. WGS2144]|uniref:OmpA family protein n=1 Tax=Alkanindiges sp. WGS2144 TaxID=3366808 RepID=UPI0037515A86
MSLFKKISLILLVSVLAACQATSGLSKKQVKVLQKQGFVLKEEGWTLALPERLLFDSNASDIKANTQTTLLTLAQQLKKVGITRLNINGHTDSTGSQELNQELSKKRAETVASALVTGGLPASNIKTRGLAASQPIASNETVEGRAENRRVTIIVVP